MASALVVSVTGTVNWRLATNRWAISLRFLEIGIRCAFPAAVIGEGKLVEAAFTSHSRTRPPAPEPIKRLQSIPKLVASLLALGLATCWLDILETSEITFS